MSRSIVRIATAAALVAAIAVPGVAEAQRSAGSWRVPRGHQPPPGMCRIWVDGVPPGRQPAPMDCATAIRMKPRNARVIHGDRVVLVDGKRPKKSKHWKHGRRDRRDDRPERDDDRWERDDDRWERRDDRVHRDDRERTSGDSRWDILLGRTPR